MNESEKLAIYSLSGFTFLLSLFVICFACFKTKNIEEEDDDEEPEETPEIRDLFIPGNRNAIYVNREFGNARTNPEPYPISNQNFITFIEDGVSETDI